MHRMSELVRMLREARSHDLAQAVDGDVAEMVQVCGYSPNEAGELLIRQIDFHASFQKEKD
jgi:hypothetical protein